MINIDGKKMAYYNFNLTYGSKYQDLINELLKVLTWAIVGLLIFSYIKMDEITPITSIVVMGGGIIIGTVAYHLLTKNLISIKA